MLSPITNSLVRLRERGLNTAFAIPARQVLNPRPFTGRPVEGPALAGTIKQAVNQFKSAAMDHTGHHVDYQKLRETESYHQYTRELVPQLQSIDLSDLAGRSISTAFWINLYNALVIHAVIAFGVRESIAAGRFAGQVRFFRQAAYTVGGLRFSLEDIEHGILRANRGNPFQFSPQIPSNDPRFRFIIQPVDPRIHFALNCASVSCPPIGVYDPHRLDHQLDLAAANYIQQETELAGGRLSISKLFSWYKKDFGSARDIAAFLLNHLPNDERKAWLQGQPGSPAFRYLPYDWGLNIAPG